MRIQLVSDVHGRFDKVEVDKSADIIVCPGDVAENLPVGLEFLKKLEKPVIFIPGNHEFYKYDLTERIEELKYHCSQTPNVVFLDNDTIILEQEKGEDVRIIGTTLWSDFGGFNPLLADTSGAYMNDYIYIGAKNLLSDREFAKKVDDLEKYVDSNIKKHINERSPAGDIYKTNYHMRLKTIESKLSKLDNFDKSKLSIKQFNQVCRFKDSHYTPAISYLLHLHNREWLEDEMSESFDGKTLVLTHHAPSKTALSMSRFTTSIPTMDFSNIFKRNTNGYKIGAYASSFENCPYLNNIDAWVHGHFHERMIYRLGNAAVHCNPTGNRHNQPDRTGLPQYTFTISDEEKTQALAHHINHTIFIASRLSELYSTILGGDRDYFEQIRHKHIYFNVYDELETLMNSLKTTPEFKNSFNLTNDLFLPLQGLYEPYLTIDENDLINEKDLYRLLNETKERVNTISVNLSEWVLDVNSSIKDTPIFKDFTSETIVEKNDVDGELD